MEQQRRKPKQPLPRQPVQSAHSIPILEPLQTFESVESLSELASASSDYLHLIPSAPDSVLLEDEEDLLSSWTDLQPQSELLQSMYPSAPPTITLQTETFLQTSRLIPSAPFDDINEAPLSLTKTQCELLEIELEKHLELEKEVAREWSVYEMDVKEFLREKDLLEPNDELYSNLGLYESLIIEFEVMQEKVAHTKDDIERLERRVWRLEKVVESVTAVCEDDQVVSIRCSNERSVLDLAILKELETRLDELRALVFKKMCLIEYRMKYTGLWIDTYITSKLATLPSPPQLVDSILLKGLVHTLDTLFLYLPKGGVFKEKVYDWIIRVSTGLYYSNDITSYRRVQLHLLRTRSISEWGVALLQPNTDLALFVVLLKSLLSPIEEVEEELKVEREREVVVRREMVGREGNEWIVVDDFLVKSAVKKSIILAQSDYCVLFNQLEVMKVVKRYVVLMPGSESLLWITSIVKVIMDGFEVVPALQTILAHLLVDLTRLVYSLSGSDESKDLIVLKVVFFLLSHGDSPFSIMPVVGVEVSNLTVQAKEVAIKRILKDDLIKNLLPLESPRLTLLASLASKDVSRAVRLGLIKSSLECLMSIDLSHHQQSLYQLLQNVLRTDTTLVSYTLSVLNPLLYPLSAPIFTKLDSIWIPTSTDVSTLEDLLKDIKSAASALSISIIESIPWCLQDLDIQRQLALALTNIYLDVSFSASSATTLKFSRFVLGVIGGMRLADPSNYTGRDHTSIQPVLSHSQDPLCAYLLLKMTDLGCDIEVFKDEGIELLKFLKDECLVEVGLQLYKWFGCEVWKDTSIDEAALRNALNRMTDDGQLVINYITNWIFFNQNWRTGPYLKALDLLCFRYYKSHCNLLLNTFNATYKNMIFSNTPQSYFRPVGFPVLVMDPKLKYLTFICLLVEAYAEAPLRLVWKVSAVEKPLDIFTVVRLVEYIKVLEADTSTALTSTKSLSSTISSTLASTLPVALTSTIERTVASALSSTIGGHVFGDLRPSSEGVDGTMDRLLLILLRAVWPQSKDLITNLKDVRMIEKLLGDMDDLEVACSSLILSDLSPTLLSTISQRNLNCLVGEITLKSPIRVDIGRVLLDPLKYSKSPQVNFQSLLNSLSANHHTHSTSNQIHTTNSTKYIELLKDLYLNTKEIKSNVKKCRLKGCLGVVMEVIVEVAVGKKVVYEALKGVKGALNGCGDFVQNELVSVCYSILNPSNEYPMSENEEFFKLIQLKEESEYPPAKEVIENRLATLGLKGSDGMEKLFDLYLKGLVMTSWFVNFFIPTSKRWVSMYTTLHSSCLSLGKESSEAIGECFIKGVVEVTKEHTKSVIQAILKGSMHYKLLNVLLKVNPKVLPSTLEILLPLVLKGALEVDLVRMIDGVEIEDVVVGCLEVVGSWLELEDGVRLVMRLSRYWDLIQVVLKKTTTDDSAAVKKVLISIELMLKVLLPLLQMNKKPYKVVEILDHKQSFAILSLFKECTTLRDHFNLLTILIETPSYPLMQCYYDVFETSLVALRLDVEGFELFYRWSKEGLLGVRGRMLLLAWLRAGTVQLCGSRKCLYCILICISPTISTNSIQQESDEDDPGFEVAREFLLNDYFVDLSAGLLKEVLDELPIMDVMKVVEMLSLFTKDKLDLRVVVLEYIINTLIDNANYRRVVLLVDQNSFNPSFMHLLLLNFNNMNRNGTEFISRSRDLEALFTQSNHIENIKILSNSALPMSLLTSFLELLIYTHIVSNKQTWLLVLDNITVPELDLTLFVKNCVCNGRVLLLHTLLLLEDDKVKAINMLTTWISALNITTLSDSLATLLLHDFMISFSSCSRAEMEVIDLSWKQIENVLWKYGSEPSLWTTLFGEEKGFDKSGRFYCRLLGVVLKNSRGESVVGWEKGIEGDLVQYIKSTMENGDGLHMIGEVSTELRKAFALD